jgi:hypothetical protein
VVLIAIVSEHQRLALKGETGIGIHEDVLVNLAHVSASVVGGVFRSPDEAADTALGHCFVEQEFELGAVLVVYAAEQDAVFSQEVAGDDEAMVKKLKPGGEPPGVVLVHEAIVIDKVLFAGVVGWVNEDALDLPSERHPEVTESVVVVALNDEIAPRPRALAFLGVQIQGDEVIIEGLVSLNLVRFPYKAEAGGITAIPRLQEAE